MTFRHLLPQPMDVFTLPAYMVLQHMHMYTRTEARLCGNEMISEAVSFAAAHRNTYMYSDLPSSPSWSSSVFDPEKPPTFHWIS